MTLKDVREKKLKMNQEDLAELIGDLSMKIILLSGESKSGKSTALRLLYDKLREKPERQYDPRKKSYDIERDLQYKDKTVAIKSKGDDYWECVKTIIKHANKNVLVLAYNNTLKSEHPLDKLVLKYAPPHCVVKKKSITDTNKEKEDKKRREDKERVCEEIIKQL
jgi:tRNA uridine 5-carbamoylmethylation protein Kti12